MFPKLTVVSADENTRIASLTAYLAGVRDPLTLACHRDVARNRRLFLARAPDGVELRASFTGPFADVVRTLWDRGASAVTDFFVLTQLVSAGPKVYRPSALDAEALTHVRVTLGLDEYRQPFPAFAVECPAGLRDRGGVCPLAVVLYNDVELSHLVASVLQTDGTSCTYTLAHATGRSIEETLALADRWQRVSPGSGELDFAPGESEAAVDCLRMAVNACLLLTHFGCVRLGYDNPQHAARLERRQSKRTAHADAARDELSTLPVIYGFDQHVQLYRHEGGGGGGTAGHGVGPHWRSGHFCNQPCGPGHALRKRIYRQPVMVRADRFGGDASETQVTYTGKP